MLFVARDVGYSELYWFLRSLRAHGVLDRLLLVCPSHFFDVHPDVVPYHLDDLGEDPDRLAGRIQSWLEAFGRPIEAVIGVDEDQQFRMSRRLAALFGLPFHGEPTCARASNKYLLKRHLDREGVRTAPYLLLRDPRDPGIDRVGFPAVLKAVSSYGSQYLARCDDRAALERSLETLRDAARRANGDPRFRPQSFRIDGERIAVNPRTDFLLERWIGGEEFSCDFLVRDGAVQVVRVAHKMPGPHFGFFDGTRVLGAAAIEASGVGIGRLTAVCEGIRRALEVDGGLCMVDFKLEGGEIVVLEASVRPGLSATNHLVYELYGWTPLALLAMEAMGLRPDVRIPEESGALVYLYAGLDHLDPAHVAELEALHGAERVYLYHAGEEAGPVPDADPSTLIRGYVIVRDLDGEDWETVATQARARRRTHLLAGTDEPTHA